MTTAGADHSQIRSVGGRRPAATSRGEHLVERHVQRGILGLVADEPPVVVAPAAGPGEGAPDRAATAPAVNPASTASPPSAAVIRP